MMIANNHRHMHTCTNFQSQFTVNLIFKNFEEGDLELFRMLLKNKYVKMDEIFILKYKNNFRDIIFGCLKKGKLEVVDYLFENGKVFDFLRKERFIDENASFISDLPSDVLETIF